MVLKATLQKERPKQSLPKVTSEAAVHRCSSTNVLWPITLFKRDFNTGAFLRILRNFYEKLFLKNSSGGIWRSSLLNQKQCGRVSTKVFRSGHSVLFKVNNQSKPLQQKLFVLILGF